MKTLSLQTCQLLYSVVGEEVGTYLWWTIPEGKYVEVFMRLNPAYEDDDTAPTRVQLTENPDFYGNYGEPVNKVPAYAIDDILSKQFLEVLGRKLGWGECRYSEYHSYEADGDWVQGTLEPYKHHAHKLLELSWEGTDKVEQYLEELI